MIEFTLTQMIILIYTNNSEKAKTKLNEHRNERSVISRNQFNAFLLSLLIYIHGGTTIASQGRWSLVVITIRTVISPILLVIVSLQITNDLTLHAYTHGIESCSRENEEIFPIDNPATYYRV